MIQHGCLLSSACCSTNTKCLCSTSPWRGTQSTLAQSNPRSAFVLHNCHIFLATWPFSYIKVSYSIILPANLSRPSAVIGSPRPPHRLSALRRPSPLFTEYARRQGYEQRAQVRAVPTAGADLDRHGVRPDPVRQPAMLAVQGNGRCEW